MFTDEELIFIHNAIHNETGITLSDNSHIPVTRTKGGLRELVVKGVRFIEQNPDKTTKYALLARQGHKLTWGIRDPKWILIIDGKIEQK